MSSSGTARDYVPKSDESLADYIKRENIGSFTLGAVRGQCAGIVQRRRHPGLWRHVVPAESHREGDRPQRQRGAGPDRLV